MAKSKVLTIRFNDDELAKLSRIFDSKKSLSSQIKKRLLSHSSSGASEEDMISLLESLLRGVGSIHASVSSVQDELSDTRQRLKNIEDFLEKISEE
jgi:hypothetical protein